MPSPASGSIEILRSDDHLTASDCNTRLLHSTMPHNAFMTFLLRLFAVSLLPLPFSESAAALALRREAVLRNVLMCITAKGRTLSGRGSGNANASRLTRSAARCLELESCGVLASSMDPVVFPTVLLGYPAHRLCLDHLYARGPARWSRRAFRGTRRTPIWARACQSHRREPSPRGRCVRMPLAQRYYRPCRLHL